MKRFKSKKGQVFLIGAVLFAVVILSLVAFNNKIVLGSPNYDFDSVARNVKGEMVKVVESEIISDQGGRIEDFIENVSVYLGRSYPGADFIFIYGNNSGAFLINYSEGEKTQDTYTNENNITLELNGVEYVAELYSNEQVYFAIEKIGENEAFVGFA